MKLYLAVWFHTFGEYEGYAGIFTTAALAQGALDRLAPNSGHEIVELPLNAYHEDENNELYH